MNHIRTILVSALILVISACGGDQFEGTYEGAGGSQEFVFKPDGKVVQSLLGNEVAEFKYEKDGNEIKIYLNADTSQIFTIKETGELVGPGGVTLTPK